MAKTVTTLGSATISTTQKKIGSASGSFPNTSSAYSDGLSLANSTDWAFGSNAWTIEGWVYLTASGDHFFMGHAQDSSNFLAFRINTGGTLECYSAINSNEFLLDVTGWGTISQNAWHHIAFCRKDNANSSSSWLFFVDGVAGTTYNKVAGEYNVTLTTPSGVVHIGGTGATNYECVGLSGYIDEFRILNGTCAYTSNFTPSTTQFYGNTSPNTKLLLHMDGTNGSTTFIDSSDVFPDVSGFYEFI